MAMVPMKQSVIIQRKGVADEWGEGGAVTSFTLKCRVDERTQVVQNQIGDEVVSGMEILFNKLPDVRYDDVIEYTNELGVTIKRTPIKIEPVRMINGKPTLTAVHL
ncbi:hypothetical protein [Peribacillus butanolivorans]|uniref:hypothetical protein n=1 Tax=Peribacillus butanolivorans TaxID=421767 RepID=UPI00207D5870|nr:hypothetical protein [Peribacillus butanolivorans]